MQACTFVHTLSEKAAVTGQQTGDTLRVRVFEGATPFGCGFPSELGTLQTRALRVFENRHPSGAGFLRCRHPSNPRPSGF